VAAVLTVTLAISGCGTKNVDYSLKNGEDKAAAGDDGSSELRKNLALPQNCDLSFDVGDSGLTSISLKTEDIEVPDVENMYRFSFDTEEFYAEASQKFVESILEKDKGIYYDDGSVETKDDIQETINVVENEIANGEYTDPNDPDSEANLESAKDYLEELKEEIKTAPDTLPEVTGYDNTRGQYRGERDGKKWRVFYYKGDPTGVFVSAYTKDVDDDSISKVDGATSEEYLTPEDIVDFDDEGMTNQCKLSQDEAIGEAMQILSDAGIEGFSCSQVTPIVHEWENGVDVLYYELDGYEIELERDLSGGSIYSEDIAQVDNLLSDNGYFNYPKEEIKVDLNDSGLISIVGNIDFDVSTMEKQDISLLPWEDMIKKADQEIGDYYSEYPTKYKNVEFNSAKLCYTYCCDEAGNRYYEPTWVLVQYEDTADEEDKEVRQVVYIDATDGSVIDILENLKTAGYWQEY
jgi:hypothetical protein